MGQFSTGDSVKFIPALTRITQVHYDINKNNRIEVDLNTTTLVEEDNAQNGRFTLYPTKNIYNFIIQTFQGKKYLVETSTGKRYQNDYISKQIKKIGKLIGRKISAHNLRHTWFTNKIKENPADIKAISVYGGHSDVSITLNMYHHTVLTNEQLFNDELFSLIH